VKEEGGREEGGGKAEGGGRREEGGGGRGSNVPIHNRASRRDESDRPHPQGQHLRHPLHDPPSLLHPDGPLVCLPCLEEGEGGVGEEDDEGEEGPEVSHLFEDWGGCTVDLEF
jgi:hypothetical protein